MKDEDVVFDRRYHVIYSKECKAEILNKIALHYPKEQVDEVFEAVQFQYSDYLKDYRTDLGGKANFHNGVAGTYDCIALFSYYKVCQDKTSFAEIEEMNNNLFIPAFRKLGFVDCNKEIYKRLLHFAFKMSAKKYNLQIYKRCIEKYANHAENGTFSMEDMDEEDLFIIPSLESKRGKATTMNEFLMYCRKTGIRIDCHIGRIFCNVSDLSVEHDFHMADYIFFKKLHGNHTKSQGKYLVYTNITDGTTITELYTDFLTYIKEMHLTVVGNIYEDYPLSGIFSSDREMHFIRICVKVE